MEFLKVIEKLFYDSITRFGYAFKTFFGALCASVVTSTTERTEGPVGVVGAPATPKPTTESDAHVVVMEKASPGLVESDSVEQDAEMGTPPASDLVAKPVTAKDATGNALTRDVASGTVGKVGRVAFPKVASDLVEQGAIKEATHIVADSNTVEPVAVGAATD